MRFSSRVPESLAPNRLATARARCGTIAYDLTVSNPTRVGLAYPQDLLAPLADPAGLAYRPEPTGLADARRAVCEELARHRVEVDPARVVLTASTSEAYALLFKLLCAPGDAVLAPVPSYPLFEHLARADAVAVVPYQLDRDAFWRLDLAAVAAAGARVRAIIVVHPNNPTGSFVHPDDATALADLCAERDWALIADEVFLDFPLDGGPGAGWSFAAVSACATFTLGGLSKSCGLPQLKLGWITVSGPPATCSEALERLTFLADTYLSVATPVQLALPRLLRDAAPVREAILERCRANLAGLRRVAAAAPALEVLPAGGGWSAVLRFPDVVDEETLAVELLEREGVAVYPGFMFDFARPGHLVVSLLPEPDCFGAGVDRLLHRLDAHLVRG